jgi:hypothetical protein
MRTDEAMKVETIAQLHDTACHEVARLTELRESDAKVIAALRATILNIGDLADKATHGGGTTFLYGVTLRDIIFRCATALSPTGEQTAGRSNDV